jgi:hypothetical protein
VCETFGIEVLDEQDGITGEPRDCGGGF